MGNIYKDTVGLEVLIETSQILTGATNIVLHIKKPSGEYVTWSGATVYQISKLRYTTVDGDLDEAGWYMIYPVLTLGSWNGAGKPDKIEVKDPRKPYRLQNR